jgi:hypothetical protein
MSTHPTPRVTWHTVAGRVAASAALDPRWYAPAEVMVTAQTYEGATAALTAAIAAARNDRPRPVTPKEHAA